MLASGTLPVAMTSSIFSVGTPLSLVLGQFLELVEFFFTETMPFGGIP